MNEKKSWLRPMNKKGFITVPPALSLIGGIIVFTVLILILVQNLGDSVTSTDPAANFSDKVQEEFLDNVGLYGLMIVLFLIGAGLSFLGFLGMGGRGR